MDKGKKGTNSGFFYWLLNGIDYIDQNLLITKLYWYAVTTNSPKLTFSLLKIPYVKCCDKYLWTVSQKVSFLDIYYLTSTLLECEDDNINSYMDNTTFYLFEEDVFFDYESSKTCEIFFRWHENNHMKADTLLFNLALKVEINNHLFYTDYPGKILLTLFHQHIRCQSELYSKLHEGHQFFFLVSLYLNTYVSDWRNNVSLEQKDM